MPGANGLDGFAVEAGDRKPNSRRLTKSRERERGVVGCDDIFRLGLLSVLLKDRVAVGVEMDQFFERIAVKSEWPRELGEKRFPLCCPDKAASLVVG